jgi:Arc/MetJ-type ribon-helix-helix transcriptional regulator
MSGLLAADDARGDLEQSLTEMIDRAVAADPFVAATEFVRAQSALDGARRVAEELVAAMRR